MLRHFHARSVMIGVLSLALTSLFIAVSPSATLAAARQGQVRTTKRAPVWYVKQTVNFNVYAQSSQSEADQLAVRCEQLREQLAGVWLGQRPCAGWAKRCDVIVYPNLNGYLQAVGREAVQTAGSALIEMDGTTVAARRIDLRGDLGGEMQSALAHELTHVIIADRIDRAMLPAWADEGMAVLADHPSKQDAHLADLRGGIHSRQTFRTAELVALAGYPEPGRMGVFYGQSGSLVSFLVHRGTPLKFVEFLEIALESGYDRALKQVYQINGVEQLERDWRKSLGRGEMRFASYVPGAIWQKSPAKG